MPKVPLVRPSLPSVEELAPLLREIVDSGRVSNFGPLATAFEEAAARTFFAEEQLTCVATNSGTAAIEIALQGLNLPPGSAVLMPAFGFAAVAVAAARLGLTPIFGDVDPARWEITTEIAERHVGAQAIAAVLAVSPFGYPLDTASWAQWARRRGVPVIVDAAAGLGNQTGCDGLTVAFSLHATKPFAVGEGGLIAVSDPSRANELRARCNFGMTDRVAHIAGGNAKLSEWHGAIALAQLRRWPRIQAEIRQVRACYRESLTHLGLRLHPDAWTSPVAAFMPVGFADETTARRAIAALELAGIESRRWFHPILPEHPAFAPWANDMPFAVDHARTVAATTVCLPFHTFIRRSDTDLIARTIAPLL